MIIANKVAKQAASVVNVLNNGMSASLALLCNIPNDLGRSFEWHDLELIDKPEPEPVLKSQEGPDSLVNGMVPVLANNTPAGERQMRKAHWRWPRCFCPRLVSVHTAFER